MVWIETPTNPNLKITDIAAAAELCKARGVSLIIDNTFASPSLQKPIEFGATAVLHSVSKYIGGHSDTIMGAICMNDEEMHAKLRYL